jgi:hypothetical protein
MKAHASEIASSPRRRRGKWLDLSVVTAGGFEIIAGVVEFSICCDILRAWLV